MGLTMAEVGILIIFVLLMLIGFTQWQSYEQARSYRTINNERFQVLEKAELSLTQLKEALHMPPNSSVDEIQTLVRAVQESASHPEGQSALKEAHLAFEEMNKIKNEIVNGGGNPQLVEQTTQLSYRNANQEGQLQRYELRLNEAGLGKGERPCWVQPDGTIDYLYDVVLESNGIRMRERRYPEREEESSSLLPIMPIVDPQEVLSQSEFVRRTYPLYERSKQLNCRFFVVIYDGTGPTEKEIYKSLLRTVEGHFYKLLANGTPIF